MSRVAISTPFSLLLPSAFHFSSGPLINQFHHKHRPNFYHYFPFSAPLLFSYSIQFFKESKSVWFTFFTAWIILFIQAIVQQPLIFYFLPALKSLPLFQWMITFCWVCKRYQLMGSILTFFSLFTHTIKWLELIHQPPKKLYSRAFFSFEKKNLFKWQFTTGLKHRVTIRQKLWRM